MTSQDDEKVFFHFDDHSVFELDYQLVSGEISLEEYKKRISEL